MLLVSVCAIFRNIFLVLLLGRAGDGVGPHVDGVSNVLYLIAGFGLILSSQTVEPRVLGLDGLEEGPSGSRRFLYTAIPS